MIDLFTWPNSASVWGRFWIQTSKLCHPTSKHCSAVFFTLLSLRSGPP